MSCGGDGIDWGFFEGDHTCIICGGSGIDRCWKCSGKAWCTSCKGTGYDS